MEHYLIFDIGGTSVKYACADNDGNLEYSGAFPTPQEGINDLLTQMRSVYERIKRESEIGGIAVSSPGAVDPESGIVGGISAIPYIHGFPLTYEISRRLDGLPAAIENDANCAALGELWKGAAAGKRNIVSVVCGTGIGGSVVIDGRIYRGQTNNGGEFGNYLINREEGQNRTWSFYTMVRQSAKYEKRTGKKVDGKKLFWLAKEGDPDALSLTEEFYQAMAVGLFNIQFTLDTELIVLGGGVSEAPFVIPEIQKRMEQMAAADCFGFLMPVLVPCRFGNKANLYGALFHYMNQYIKNKTQ